MIEKTLHTYEKQTCQNFFGERPGYNRSVVALRHESRLVVLIMGGYSCSVPSRRRVVTFVPFRRVPWLQQSRRVVTFVFYKGNFTFYFK